MSKDKTTLAVIVCTVITTICTLASVFLTLHSLQIQQDIYQIESAYEPRVLAQIETIELVQHGSYQTKWETALIVSLIVASPHQGEVTIENSTFSLNQENSFMLDDEFRDRTTVELTDEECILTPPPLHTENISVPISAEIWLDPYYSVWEETIDLGIFSFEVEYYDIQTRKSLTYNFETNVVWMKP